MRYSRKYARKPRRRQLRGYELQSILYRTAVPLSGLFAGVTGTLAWSAGAAGPGPLRGILLVIAGLFFCVAALLLLRAYAARRFLNAYHSIKELLAMNPFEFEHYVANLFRRLGYQAKVTAASGDFGVDIVLKKGGQPAAVQCKRYAEHKYVDSPDIQRFIGSMEIYRISRGFFVATTRASPPAAKLAAAHGIEIIDDEQLIRLVQKTFPREEVRPTSA